MGEEETITVAEVSGGPDAGAPVELPVVEVLTGRSFLTGKSGSGKSVLEGTTVYTESGRKPIESVEEGERVLSLNKHDYTQEYREVLATIEHESDELLRITLEDGTELVGTKDHSFLTVDDLEIVPIRGEDVKEGTWMPTVREFPSVETISEIDLADYVTESKDLDVHDNAIRSAQKTDDRYLQLDFGAGKVLGLYLAEGSFDSHLTVQISNVDEAVQSFLGDNGFRVYERTSNRAFRPFGSFVESEFGRGSGGKRVPNWAHEAPDEFKAGLVSGYIDGDGTIDNTVTAMSKSPELIDGIKELLGHFGVSTTVREKFTMYEGERRQDQRLRVDAFSLPRLQEVVDLEIERKANPLDELVETLERGDRYNSKDMIPGFGSVLNDAARERDWTKRESENRVRGASAHHLTRQQKAGRATYNRFVDELGIEGRAKAFGRSDVQWKRVVEVEELNKRRTVYDLDVELNDNFVADGVFVHNSNTASVVAEKLLDRGFGLLVVDVEGEYYGLKEEYEVLHAGADEECDVRVSEEHAGKLASLALEGNVPVILDLSGFVDEREGRDLLGAVARRLFAMEKKCKQPFLLIVEEIHEYVPEGGGLDECGRTLVKVAKRGRKHGLGIAGVSQRPADVKKDFITQCDWLVWHRLTWQNDTRVVKRVLGEEYADAVEDLDDGEGFLMTDWGEQLRRVQFHRKETFDAGATPGLEDFERPELKSVSDDLVSELQEISAERARRADEIAQLEDELEERERRIAELEEALADARDLSDVAEQFARAMTAHAGPRYQPGTRAELPEYADRAGAAAPEQPATGAPPDGDAASGTHDGAGGDAASGTGGNGGDEDAAGGIGGTTTRTEGGEEDAATGTDGGDGSDEDATRGVDDGSDGLDRDVLPPEQRAIVEDAAAAAGEPVLDGGTPEEPEPVASEGGGAETDGTSGERVDVGLLDVDALADRIADAASDRSAADSPGATDHASSGEPARPGDGTGDAASDSTLEDASGSASEDAMSGSASEDAASRPALEELVAGGDVTIARSDDGGAFETPGSVVGRPAVTTDHSVDPAALAEQIAVTVEGLDDRAREMLAAYRDLGVATPEAVHEAAGGSGDRAAAYRHNRALRKHGFVVHVGAGRYAYALPSLLEAFGAAVDDDRRRTLLATAEAPL